MFITEALAEIKTVNKRLEKKREFVRGYLFRQDRLKDPLEKEGGSRAAILKERQAIDDLEDRIVALRRAIQQANERTQITVAGVTHTIADWLVWRREVAPGRQGFLKSLQMNVNGVREEARKKGVQIATGEPSSPDDVVVNVDELKLVSEIEQLETILGDLDGQLSLKNATVEVDI